MKCNCEKENIYLFLGDIPVKLKDGSYVSGWH